MLYLGLLPEVDGKVDLLSLGLPGKLRDAAVVPIYLQPHNGGYKAFLDSNIPKLDIPPRSWRKTLPTQHYDHPRNRVTLWFNLYPRQNLPASEGVGGCGMHCTHCYYVSNPHDDIRSPHLSSDELAALMKVVHKQHRSTHICRVTAADYIAKPLVDEGFWDPKKKIFASTKMVATSGRPIVENEQEVQRLLMQQGVHNVQLTIHERFDDDPQNQWRGAPLYLVKDAIKRIHSWPGDFKVTACVVLGKHNAHDLDSWMDAAYDVYHADAVRFSRVLPISPKLKNLFIPESDHDTYQEIMRQVAEGRTRYALGGSTPMGIHLSGIMGSYQPGFDSFTDIKKEKYLCPAGRGLVLSIWGDRVYNCLEVRDQNSLVGVVRRDPLQILYLTNHNTLADNNSTYHGCHGHQLAAARLSNEGKGLEIIVKKFPKLKLPGDA